VFLFWKKGKTIGIVPLKLHDLAPAPTADAADSPKKLDTVEYSSVDKSLSCARISSA
jgi:hypothetical protein